MLQVLTDYGVPGCVFLLMLVAGTDVRLADFTRLRENTRAVVAGSAGQLLALPPLVLLIHAIAEPPPEVALGTLVLALCPGGGISNYYCYLARCNVLLSATITAVGTLLSLVTIPLWLRLLPAWSDVAVAFVDVPAHTVFAQLMVLMVLPLSIGMLARLAFPEQMERRTGSLRAASLSILALIVASIVATVADDLSALLVDIDVSATLFVLCAMLVGWALGTGLSEPDRAVLVIEAGVRNIGVALILGGAILSKEGFAIFATFLTGYFVIEIAIMLIYARRKAADHAAVPVHSGERHGDPCGFRREGPRADRDRDPRRHDRRGIP